MILALSRRDEAPYKGRAQAARLLADMVPGGKKAVGRDKNLFLALRDNKVSELQKLYPSEKKYFGKLLQQVKDVHEQNGLMPQGRGSVPAPVEDPLGLGSNPPPPQFNPEVFPPFNPVVAPPQPYGGYRMPEEKRTDERKMVPGEKVIDEQPGVIRGEPEPVDEDQFDSREGQKVTREVKVTLEEPDHLQLMRNQGIILP